jgi:hypothetical protein
MVRLNRSGPTPSIDLKFGPDHFGAAAVTVRAADPTGRSAETSFTVTVTPVNDAPQLEPIADKTVVAGGLVVFTARAADPDTPLTGLVFGFGPSAPADATIDSATGQFRWTPSAAQPPGVYPVTITVADRTSPGLNDRTSFSITVNEADSFERIALSGLAFSDADSSAAREPGEAVLVGQTVQLDLGNNGTVDQTTTTDTNGQYRFDNVGRGTHRLIAPPPAGAVQTVPRAPGTYSIVAESGVDRTGLDFGFDRTPPRLVEVRIVTDARGKKITALLLSFSEPLDAAKARDVSNYTLTRVGTTPLPVTLAAAELEADPRIVRLRPPVAIKSGSFQIVVSDKLTDRSNLALDGNGDGKAGGKHTALFGRQLTILEPDGDSAALSLTSGLLVLNNGQHLQLVGAGPASTLSGTVRVSRTASDRVVHLTSISGLNGAANTLPRCTPAQTNQCIDVANVSAEIVDRLLAAGEFLDEPLLRFASRRK